MIVIDASVAIQWLLKDEPYATEALHLLHDIGDKKESPLVPALWMYETVNALRSAVVKKRISVEHMYRLIDKFKELNFQLTDLSSHERSIAHCAITYNLSIYDASYVTLAEINNCSFYTGDKKLYNKLHKDLSLVKWIGEYR